MLSLKFIENNKKSVNFEKDDSGEGDLPAGIGTCSVVPEITALGYPRRDHENPVAQNRGPETDPRKRKWGEFLSTSDKAPEKQQTPHPTAPGRPAVPLEKMEIRSLGDTAHRNEFQSGGRSE